MLPDSMTHANTHTEVSIDLCRLPPIIGSEAAGVLLGCSSEQLTAEINAGLIPAVKIGRSWRFVTGQLIECMTNRAELERKERCEKHLSRVNAAAQTRGSLHVPTTPRRRGRPRKAGPGVGH